ncbi:MAG: hypothetical protein CM1200mP10_16370 [Candidatus Neomarinimicrobiota bacterium]|nr:MAG: hypothetical protein CM1200mP10_16370 [Candidatus Neomarinimicrobiota bacterium]
MHLKSPSGVVQLLAADSINLNAQNVVITSGNEFTVDSDFKARGKVTIVDGSDSLTIHGDKLKVLLLKMNLQIGPLFSKLNW